MTRHAVKPLLRSGQECADRDAVVLVAMCAGLAEFRRPEQRHASRPAKPTETPRYTSIRCGHRGSEVVLPANGRLAPSVLRAGCSASPGPRSAGCSPRARLATFTVTAPSRGRHYLRDSGPLGRRWRHASLARPPRRAPQYGTAVDTGRTAKSDRTVVPARPGLRMRRPLSFAPSRPRACRYLPLTPRELRRIGRAGFPSAAVDEDPLLGRSATPRAGKPWRLPRGTTAARAQFAVERVAQGLSLVVLPLAS